MAIILEAKIKLVSQGIGRENIEYWLRHYREEVYKVLSWQSNDAIDQSKPTQKYLEAKQWLECVVF